VSFRLVPLMTLDGIIAVILRYIPCRVLTLWVALVLNETACMYESIGFGAPVSAWGAKKFLGF